MSKSSDPTLMFLALRGMEQRRHGEKGLNANSAKIGASLVLVGGKPSDEYVGYMRTVIADGVSEFYLLTQGDYLAQKAERIARDFCEVQPEFEIITVERFGASKRRPCLVAVAKARP